MAEPTPTFAGEVQLRRWSESNTQGVQVTFALADSSDLEKFRGLDGKRFMAVLVQIGDDEQPVSANPLISKNSCTKPELKREPLGDLCWRAVQWCKEPEFWDFLTKTICDPDCGVFDETGAKFAVQAVCCVESRKELDTNPEAARKFNGRIRGPYQKYLIARGIVR